MTSQHVLSLITLYLMLHFLTYVLILRRLSVFLKEDVILFYHAASLFLAITLICFVPFARPVSAAAGLVLGVHGIYSLSFLSFWSSSDGGYSLRIMNYLDLSGAKDNTAVLKDLEKLGESKKKDRIESVLHLKLVEKKGKTFCLTSKGRLIVGAIRAIDWVCNIRRAA